MYSKILIWMPATLNKAKQIWFSVFMHVCMCVHSKTDQKFALLAVNMCYGEQQVFRFW